MISKNPDNVADFLDFLCLNYFSTKYSITNKINEVNILSRRIKFLEVPLEQQVTYNVNQN